MQKGKKKLTHFELTFWPFSTRAAPFWIVEKHTGTPGCNSIRRLNACRRNVKRDLEKKLFFFFLVCLTENEINFIFDPKNCITLVSVVPAFQSRTSSMPKTPTPWKFQDLLFLILRRSQV